jgi:hypothetical protein
MTKAADKRGRPATAATPEKRAAENRQANAERYHLTQGGDGTNPASELRDDTYLDRATTPFEQSETFTRQHASRNDQHKAGARREQSKKTAATTRAGLDQSADRTDYQMATRKSDTRSGKRGNAFGNEIKRTSWSG